MAFFRVASFLLLASAVTATSPTAKVVQLLEDLETETKEEQSAENKTFANYSTWATTTIAAKKTAIADGESEVGIQTALIEEKSTAVEELQKTLKEQTSKKEVLEAEKLASKRQCDKDQSTYEVEKADLVSAQTALQEAIEKMAEAAGTPEPSLLQSGSKLQQTLDLAEALGFLNAPKHRAVVAFLQEGKPKWLEKEGEQYNKTDYEFQSGGIVQTLKELEVEFTSDLGALESKWNDTSVACDKTENNKKTAIESVAAAIASTTTTKGATEEELAKAKAALKDAKDTLKSDRDVLSDTQEDFDARTADFNQRSKNRAGEIEAIGAALKVMKEQVQGVESVLTNTSSTDGNETQQDSAPSFFQQISHHDNDNHAVTQANHAEAERAKAARAEAASFLSKAGSDLNSLRLSGLALRMFDAPLSAGNDPLKFLKDMTQKMLNTLSVDRTAMTTKRGQCDTQIMKASKERNRRMREATALDAKIKALNITSQELEEKISLLSTAITTLEDDLVTATKLRTEESNENLKGIADAKEGYKLVKFAIGGLKDFYRKAALNANRYDEAAAFLQQRSESAREDSDPSAGFDGSYAGKQDKALGIVTMMETIQEDFKKTAEETEKEEMDAADKFTKLKSETKVDIASKKTSRTMSKNDLEATINDLAASKTSLAMTQQLRDSAIETLADITEDCNKAEAAFQVKVEKQKEDIDMLKKALCILDTHHIIPSCDKASGDNTSEAAQ